MQNQRFGWNGVSAVDGVSYGTLDASTLGPAGTIYTTQPFYYRRPWDDNVDSEVDLTFVINKRIRSNKIQENKSGQQRKHTPIFQEGGWILREKRKTSDPLHSQFTVCVKSIFCVLSEIFLARA